MEGAVPKAPRVCLTVDRADPCSLSCECHLPLQSLLVDNGGKLDQRHLPRRDTEGTEVRRQASSAPSRNLPRPQEGYNAERLRTQSRPGLSEGHGGGRQSASMFGVPTPATKHPDQSIVRDTGLEIAAASSMSEQCTSARPKAS